METGIYKIVNTKTNSFYVGSATDIKKRWSSHKAALRKNKHPNAHLQRAWNRDSEKAFEWIIIQKCETSELRTIEQLLLDEHVGKLYCYNISKEVTGTMLGRKLSVESNKKKSVSLSGRKLSEEHKRNIGNANRGNIIGEAGRKNMSMAHIGKVLPEEQKQKISQAIRGEKGPGVKLTNAQVIEIRELYKTGQFSSRQLAKQFNLKDKKTILDIVNWKTWKHL